MRPTKTVKCCVAPQKQLDVGNYAFALLFAVRLAFGNFASDSGSQIKKKNP